MSKIEPSEFASYATRDYAVQVFGKIDHDAHWDLTNLSLFVFKIIFNTIPRVLGLCADLIRYPVHYWNNRQIEHFPEIGIAVKEKGSMAEKAIQMAQNLSKQPESVNELTRHVEETVSSLKMDESIGLIKTVLKVAVVAEKFKDSEAFQEQLGEKMRLGFFDDLVNSPNKAYRNLKENIDQLNDLAVLESTQSIFSENDVELFEDFAREFKNNLTLGQDTRYKLIAIKSEMCKMGLPSKVSPPVEPEKDSGFFKRWF